jgi:hypothetical protein
MITLLSILMVCMYTVFTVCAYKGYNNGDILHLSAKKDRLLVSNSVGSDTGLPVHVPTTLYRIDYV